MASKYFIFFDNDGVTAHFATWQNDTMFKDTLNGVGVIDIYKWNFLDRICRRLEDDVEVYAICISSWKRTFYDKRVTNKLARRAGLKKIKFFYDNKCLTPHRFSYHEPWERLSDIDNYLKKYNPTDYIIFDDEFNYEYVKHKHKDHLITTDMYNGMTYEQAMVFDKYVDEHWKVKDEYHQAKKHREEVLKTLLSCSI